jgi:hypothetical protein
MISVSVEYPISNNLNEDDHFSLSEESISAISIQLSNQNSYLF